MNPMSLLVSVLGFYEMMIFAYVILSWFPMSGVASEVYAVLNKLCEPYVGIFRRIVPTAGGIDFSPLVAILVLQVVQGLLQQVRLF